MQRSASYNLPRLLGLRAAPLLSRLPRSFAPERHRFCGSVLPAFRSFSAFQVQPNMQGRLKEQDELIGFILHQLAAQPKMTPAVYGKLARGAELRSALQLLDG